MSRVHLPPRNRVGIWTASHVSMRLVLVSDSFIPKGSWELLWLVQAHRPVFGSVKLAPIKYEKSFVPLHMKSDEGLFWKSIKWTTAMRVFALVVVHNPEMPTSGNLKSGDSSFALHAPRLNINDQPPPPTPHKHNSIQSLIGLRRYMKSYMGYRTITISVYNCDGE